MKTARKVTVTLAAAAFFAVGTASAEALSPEALVRQVAADVLGARKAGPMEASDKREALALTEERILPHVDFTEATRLAAEPKTPDVSSMPKGAARDSCWSLISRARRCC